MHNHTGALYTSSFLYSSVCCIPNHYSIILPVPFPPLYLILTLCWLIMSLLPLPRITLFHTSRAQPPISNHVPTTAAGLLGIPPQLATQLVSSLQHGFRIGYTGPRVALHAPNLSSAYSHPEAVDQALVREMAAFPPFPNLRCSGLGLVPSP